MATGRRRLGSGTTPLWPAPRSRRPPPRRPGQHRPRAPPRFDGAGYAVLARSLASGQGYREIDHPDRAPARPLPARVPGRAGRCSGGRPAAARTRRPMACRSPAPSARPWRPGAGSGRSIRPGSPWPLGLALAVNWTWDRAGGAIQSEPLFLLLGQLRPCSRRSGPAVAAGLVAGLRPRRSPGGLHPDPARRRRPRGGGRPSTALRSAGGRPRWRPAACIVAVLVSPGSPGSRVVRQTPRSGLLAQGRACRRWSPAGGVLPPAAPRPVHRPVRRGRHGLPAPGVARGRGQCLGGGWRPACSVCGWVRALRTPRRGWPGWSRFSTLALLLVWPFTEAGRFLIPLVPCLLVGAVEGLAVPAAVAGSGGPAVVGVGGWSWPLSLPYSAYALATGRAGGPAADSRRFRRRLRLDRPRGDRPGPRPDPAPRRGLTGRPAATPWPRRPSRRGARARSPRHGAAAYLLVDDDRYANAPANPLSARSRGTTRGGSAWSGVCRERGGRVVSRVVSDGRSTGSEPSNRSRP